MKIAELFASPDHFLFAFEGDAAVFLQMNREAYARSIFLDGRVQSPTGRALKVDAATLAAWNDQNGGAPAPAGFVFHVAHCGSTLLARALDLTDRSLSLREPLALRQASVDVARSGPVAPESVAARVRLVRRQLAKRYDPAAPVVVKANVPVNFALDALIPTADATPALCLYLRFEPYLAAVLRTEGHRGWVKSVSAELEPALVRETGLAADCDGRAAARLWLAQMRAYRRLLSRRPDARSLDAERLFAAPAQVLAAAFPLFGIAADADEAAAIAASDLFRRAAKSPDRAFDAAERARREAETLHALKDDLADARRWLEAAGVDPEREGDLPSPLEGR